MISYGPTIKGAHSPDERLLIYTVEKFWELTIAILKNIPVLNNTHNLKSLIWISDFKILIIFLIH